MICRLHISQVNALIWGGYPGQSGGTALFDILTGKTAPAGRLPITQYPAEYADQVPMTDMTLRQIGSTRLNSSHSGESRMPSSA